MFKNKGYWFTAVLLVLGITAVLSACAPIPVATQAPATSAEEPVETPKVAMLMAVSCDDTGWGSSACDGIEMAKEQFDIEVSISERVAIPDAETAMRDYAERGYDLIIGHGFQFGDAANNVAPDYPDTMFAVYAGTVTGDNLVSVDPLSHEVGYLAGMVAGRTSQTNKIGAVGGMDIPAVVRVLEGYCQGAQSVNPDIECLYAYVDSWDDIQKGKEAAVAMINAGADVFFHDASFVGVGMIQAAAENNVHAIGFATDQRDVAPGTVLTSVLEGIDNSMVMIIDKLLKGELEGGMLRPGMADGVFKLGPYDDQVPQEVREAVIQAQEAIAAGEVEVKEVLVPSK
jgi:basic membrane protein A